MKCDLVIANGELGLAIWGEAPAGQIKVKRLAKGFDSIFDINNVKYVDLPLYSETEVKICHMNKIKPRKIRVPLPKQKEQTFKDKTKYVRKEKHKKKI